MGTPAIAHFGTTIIEPLPPVETDQRTIPIQGVLGDQLEFLQVLGFEPALENMYPGVGRQYIYRRGHLGDVDYVELDNFTSYRASNRPASRAPRVGDSVFRLTHANPLSVTRALLERGLVQAVNPQHVPAFMAGTQPWLLLRSATGQQYELGATQSTAAGNHCVYVWTRQQRLDAVVASYQQHFGLADHGSRDFHDLGKVRWLTRDAPGLSLGLLYDSPFGLADRWTDDIFAEAGYSHFRMGALDKQQTLQTARQAFPDGGDVSFVYFEDSYLELVQA